MSRNIELQEQLRRHLILPYLYQQFLPAYTSEHYAAYAAHSITADASKHFTQLFPNFMQFAGGTMGVARNFI